MDKFNQRRYARVLLSLNLIHPATRLGPSTGLLGLDTGLLAGWNKEFRGLLFIQIGF
jgi:hypothetical protein